MVRPHQRNPTQHFQQACPAQGWGQPLQSGCVLLTPPSQQRRGILLARAMILIKGNISHWRLEPLVLKLNARC